MIKALCEQGKENLLAFMTEHYKHAWLGTDASLLVEVWATMEPHIKTHGNQVDFQLAPYDTYSRHEEIYTFKAGDFIYADRQD